MESEKKIEDLEKRFKELESVVREKYVYKKEET